MKKTMALAALACMFALSGGPATAAALDDLKAALLRLQGQSLLKATAEVRTWSRQGEGKELDEISGQAAVAIDDGARGLQVLYGKDLLQRLQQEERQRASDTKAKTPTLVALRELSPDALRPLVSAAGPLARRIEQASFKGEKADSYNGRPARLLSFALSIDKLSEKDRKYLKSFDGGFEVWIGDDGTPLASRSTQTIGARAYVVVSFDIYNAEETVYGLVGDRLVALRHEVRSSSSGMGEKGETRVTRSLQLAS